MFQRSSEQEPSFGGRLSALRPATGPRRILVAYDASAAARHALEVAMSLAEAFDATLILLNVVPPAMGNGGEYVCSLEWLDAIHHREAEQMLARVRGDLGASVPVRQVVRRGAPVDEILAAADESGADTIVMGKRPRGRLAHFLHGSTAEAVVHRAACPVVTVGPATRIGSLPKDIGGCESPAACGTKVQ